MSQHDPNRPPTVRVDIRILIPMLGILLAPILGFFIDPNLGLVVLIVATTVTGFMTRDIAKQAPPQQAKTLRMGAYMNWIMAGLAALLLLVRL